MTTKIDLNNFDFSQFQKEAIDKLKSGQSLTGKEGVLTPLIKEILEAALFCRPGCGFFQLDIICKI